MHRQGTPATLPQVVTGADIETVWSDESLRESYRKRFDWTLNLDPRYKIIAYTVAYHTHAYGVGAAFSPTELRSQCEQWWPEGFAAEDVRTGEFRALLDECVALGVLSYAPAEGAYRLRTSNILALLGSRDEVEDVLDAAESTPLPDSFDGSLLRPAYAGGITRSPLTSAQIADLLAARNQVRVIAGTEALTVARCARVLRDENTHAVYGTRSIPIKEATAANLDSACHSAAMTAGHSVVLVDLRTATPAAAAEAWTKARDAIATRVGGTLGIVLITSAAQAPLWVRATAEADASSSLTALHRYENTGLRLWLNETTIPFQDDASRADLLVVSADGRRCSTGSLMPPSASATPTGAPTLSMICAIGSPSPPMPRRSLTRSAYAPTMYYAPRGTSLSPHCPATLPTPLPSLSSWRCPPPRSSTLHSPQSGSTPQATATPKRSSTSSAPSAS